MLNQFGHSTKKKMTKVLPFFISVSVVTMNANAGDHFYLGAGLGNSYLSVEDGTGNEDEQYEFAGQVFAGWKFNEFIGLEANYADLGEYDLTGNSGIEYKAYGAQVNLYLPVSKNSRFYALGGGSTVNSKGVKVSVDKEDNSKGHIGLGYEYDFSKNVFSRIEWKRFNESVHLATLNVGYRFGSNDSQKVSYKKNRTASFEQQVSRDLKKNPTASAPAVQYQAGKNSEGYASAKNNSLDLKGKYLTDVRFESNSAKLSVLVHSQLDTAAEILKDDKDASVILYGYTDNKGTKKYNEKMSKRRIKSVVNYLTKSGVSKSRIESHFLGERGPIASNNTASGRAKNRRVRIQIVE